MLLRKAVYFLLKMLKVLVVTFSINVFIEFVFVGNFSLIFFYETKFMYFYWDNLLFKTCWKKRWPLFLKTISGKCFYLLYLLNEVMSRKVKTDTSLLKSMENQEQIHGKFSLLSVQYSTQIPFIWNSFFNFCKLCKDWKLEIIYFQKKIGK